MQESPREKVALYQAEPCAVVGALILRPTRHADGRGSFVKVFHRDEFERMGLASNFVEQFYSVSKRGVVRGMHLQVPPHEHHKMVYCVGGAVLDVIVDLRRGSPSFGRYAAVELSGGNATQLYIPAGCAHGFLALSDEVVMVYNVTSVHAGSADTGICWNSFGFVWPLAEPVVSGRDAALPPLAEFDSPFYYVPG